MRELTRAILLFALSINACTTSLNFHKPIDSNSYGFGPGIVVEEIKRMENQSLFKILRSYDYRHDASTAWGTPHSWFLMCALRDVAVERSASQIRITFETDASGDMRPLREGETFSSIGPDRLYVLVDWLRGDSGDAQKLLAQRIIPINARTEEFCTNLKRQTRKPQ